MNEGEIIPHLFRSEYRKIISVLCRHFGFTYIETAEDIASETFLTAVQAWGVKGIPANPVAWLYEVAKNKAKTQLQRQKHYQTKVAAEINMPISQHDKEDIDLSPANISDSQLQMMFTICHPSISEEAQVALSLRILCGFGIEEIADAFLTGKETISKRIYRAKEKLREEKIDIRLPEAGEINLRLKPVLRTIYLLFNEGYYSVSQDRVLRKELCLEAMRLCTMLVENEATDQPEVNALLSLMCFHASRFDARVNEHGELILYDDQDRQLWNADFISKGAWFLHRSASGTSFSKYHLEAGIAYWHTQPDSKQKWENVLQLYDRLLEMDDSAIIALNRVYALSKVKGKRQGIMEAEKLNLSGNYLYFSLLGELYNTIDNKKAKQYFEQALQLSKSNAARQSILTQLTGYDNLKNNKPL